MEGYPDSDAEPLIVGIGASAGGAQALRQFFEALPAEPNAAFVVVVHLEPEYRGQLADILADRTTMPVEQVAGTTRLKNNHVYVIPPGSRLVIADHNISACRMGSRGRSARRSTCSSARSP